MQVTPEEKEAWVKQHTEILAWYDERDKLKEQESIEDLKEELTRIERRLVNEEIEKEQLRDDLRSAREKIKEVKLILVKIKQAIAEM